MSEKQPWELSEEKIDQIAKGWMRKYTSSRTAFAAEAQKKLMRWDNETCKEHSYIITEATKQGTPCNTSVYRNHRDCPQCQQSKREWAEGGE